MKHTVASILVLLLLAAGTHNAHASSIISFGSGANQFSMEFVPIGSAGNAPDDSVRTSPGAVNYAYQIGRFEVSEDMVDKASAEGGLGITQDTRGPNMPATNISWFEAATFVNWLNTSTGSSAAYRFDGGGNFQLWESGDAGFDPSNPYRNANAIFVLPSIDEWHKAAYFDPVAGLYNDYATASDDRPDGLDFAGDPDYDVVFREVRFDFAMPRDVSDAGAFSAYGTMGQSGNVFEWHESASDGTNDETGEFRRYRGGSYIDWGVGFLSSGGAINTAPTSESSFVGFRVAIVPKPAEDLRILRAADGPVILSWTSQVGESYTIQTSSDLALWLDVTPIIATSKTTTWQDPTLATGDRHYFRVLSN